jgi:transposase
LIDLDAHRDVFTWVLARLGEAGLVTGHTVAIDATTLEANAALRHIVRRDTGEGYQEFLTKLAEASGIVTPTRADLTRLDRKRKKKGANKDWTSPSDPDAKITKMKDGRTHLAYKAEHAVDLDTGAIVAVTIQGADQGDTSTLPETLAEAVEQLDRVTDADGEPVALADEVVADKGCHSRAVVLELSTHGFRPISVSPSVAPNPGGIKTRRRARRRLRQSAPPPRRSRKAAPSPARGTGRTQLRPHLRQRRHASSASARGPRTSSNASSCRPAASVSAW